MILHSPLIAFLILLSYIQLTAASTLEVRKPRENLVLCDGMVPDLWSPLWPDAVPPPRRIFWNLNHLCRWLDTNPRSLGCFCFNYGDETTCSPQYADGELWTSESLREFCKGKCKCPRPREETGTRRSRPGDLDSTTRFGFNPGRRVDPAAQMGRNQPLSEIFVSPLRVPPLRQNFGLSYQARAKSINSAAADLEVSSCVASCTKSNFKCASNRCQCRVNRVEGGLWNLIGCTASKLGKRDDEESSCPCNASYVSHGCCDSKHGLVWEHPNQNLGRLEL